MESGDNLELSWEIRLWWIWMPGAETVTLSAALRQEAAHDQGLVVMALFRCSRCGCEDDTALCHYWAARLRETPAVCSVCDPKIGKWHGEFPQNLDTPNAASPTGAVRKLVGLTRLADAGLRLAEANEAMIIGTLKGAA